MVDVMSRIAVVPLGRPTFDVEYASRNLAGMFACLDATGHEITGPREMLLDPAAARAELANAISRKPDLILVLQVTFTDAVVISEIAGAFAGAMAIWAIPEPRAGGRLRLNSFCGLNLASHALGLAGREFGWLYASPHSKGVEGSLADLVAGSRKSGLLRPKTFRAASEARGQEIASSLRGARIGRIGEHPPGFDTCAYSSELLGALAKVEVTELALGQFFEAAHAVDPKKVEELRTDLSASVSGLDQVDPAQLRMSLALKLALDAFQASGRFDAFAIRCWPEMFTEYGGAVCGPVAMMGEARIPCACEADVYGALSQLLLQSASGSPVFLTDLVDVDDEDNTIVVWHCGQAPESMCGTGTRQAQIHSNRKMPLLFQFPLKPGRVTLARVSQARGQQFLAIAGGEVLDRPMSFTGTSGVVRTDTPAELFSGRLIASGLEHHLALAYGDHRADLISAAAALGLPVLEL
jgi:L-fucose isomerase-like protein